MKNPNREILMDTWLTIQIGVSATTPRYFSKGKYINENWVCITA
jgi:hypothetical protein